MRTEPLKSDIGRQFLVLKGSGCCTGITIPSNRIVEIVGIDGSCYKVQTIDNPAAHHVLNDVWCYSRLNDEINRNFKEINMKNQVKVEIPGEDTKVYDVPDGMQAVIKVEFKPNVLTLQEYADNYITQFNSLTTTRISTGFPPMQWGNVDLRRNLIAYIITQLNKAYPGNTKYSVYAGDSGNIIEISGDYNMALPRLTSIEGVKEFKKVVSKELFQSLRN